MRFKCCPLEGHLQLVTAVAFSTEGSNACSASADGSCRIWCVEDAACYFVLKGDKRVASCNFSPDGRTIVTGDWGHLARVWDAVVGKPILSLAGHQGKLTASCFRSDGTIILTASEDKNVRTWDQRRGVSNEFSAPDEMLDCKFAPDMMSVAGACKNGNLLVWDVRKPDVARLEISAHETDWVTGCAFSPCGSKVLTCSVDRSMKLWDANEGTHIQTFQGHQESVNTCRFLGGDHVVSGSGNRFWGSKDNTVIVWDVSTGQSFRTLKGHSDAVMGLDTCCQTEKLMVVTASMDKTVRIWICGSAAPKKKESGATGLESSADCKFGCGIRMSMERMTNHEAQCPQRMTYCPSCQKAMTARELESHGPECSEKEYECACGAKVRNRNRKRHEQDECLAREVECTLGCGIMIKYTALDSHVKVSCPERLVKCTMGCGASVTARNLARHQQNGCQLRDETCELCMATFQAKEAEQHKRRYCPMREVQCRLGCKKRFPAKDTEAHETCACSMRLVDCSKGCGQTFAAKDKASHEATCNGHPSVDPSWLRAATPLNSVRPRPPPLSISRSSEDLPSLEVSSPATPKSSLLLPGLESPRRRNQKSPVHMKSPDQGKAKCSACGHSKRTCSNCFDDFCSRCLVRSGLPKSNPPLCATCSRESSVRARELLARERPSPMRFGGK